MAKILVVDDHEMTRIAMQAVLEKSGHQVLVAENGLGVEKRVRTERPDILVTDLLMPDQDGLGLISAIRSFDERLPIIAVSGAEQMVGVNYLEYARDMGATAILAKPFRKEQLLAVIDQVCAGQTP